jgi:endonuclease YncB( thermonuclease family)
MNFSFSLLIASVFAATRLELTREQFEPFHAHVKEVVNGSLIKVRRHRGRQYEEFYVRLYGTDAPAVTTIDGNRQHFSRESRRFLAEKILGRTIFVVPQRVDVYNVVNALAFLNHKNLNIEMVANGLAWVYRYSRNADPESLMIYDPDDPRNSSAAPALNRFYREMYHAQRHAMRRRLNIWSRRNPMTPFKFRSLNLYPENARRVGLLDKAEM